MNATVPKLSVILATDCYRTIRPVISHLRTQKVRDQIEVVIVSPSLSTLEADWFELRGFADVKTIEVGSIRTLASARAVGVRVSQAPVVFLGETHSYAQEGWAETLIAAHTDAWAAVVPGIGNANPENAVSWAGLLVDYGPWLQGLPRREAVRIPTWNTAYKRVALLAHDTELEALLSYGDSLLVRLKADGHRFLFEPAARLHHVNIARLGPWLKERYFGGLVVSSSRMKDWTIWRRVVYVCGAPLIPLVMLARSLKAVAAARRVERLPLSTYPLMIFGTIVSSFGEMVGYAGVSAGPAEAAMTEYEVHKMPHTTVSGR